MNKLDALIALLLSSVGLTVLLVWPENGPSAWMRDRVLRRVLPERTHAMLDCYICAGFWCGLILSPLWWCYYREVWCWVSGLMTPALFWFVLRHSEKAEK